LAAEDAAAAQAPGTSVLSFGSEEWAKSGAAPAEESTRASGLPGMPSAPSLLDRIPADLSTYLLLAGSLLVVIFLFLPLVDHASIGRAEAKISAADAEQRRLDRALTADGKPSADDLKRRDESRTEWKNKKSDLEDLVQDAKTSAEGSRYWYTWGMMLGFMLLAAASIGYLRDPAKIKRVVGSVIICSLLLLVFFAFVIASVAKTP
jgi:hypothetical protein